MNAARIYRSKNLAKSELLSLLDAMRSRSGSKRFFDYTKRDRKQMMKFGSASLPSINNTSDFTRVSFFTLEKNEDRFLDLQLFAAKCVELECIQSIVRWTVKDLLWGTQSKRGFALSVGNNESGYFYGISLSSDLSIGYDSVSERCGFYQKSLVAAELDSAVDLSMNEEDLWLRTNSDEWKLKFPIAEVGGKNPHAFTLSGFADFESALKCGMRTIASFGAAATLSVSASFLPDKYESSRSPLNLAYSGLWNGSIHGEHSSSLQELISENSDSGDWFVPAFSWWLDEIGPEILVAVVGRNGAHFVELALLKCDPNRFPKELDFGVNFEFTPMKA